MRRRGCDRRRKHESEREESELSDEKDDEVATEEEDAPVKRAEETSSHSKERAASICFSDDDDDMHVDFDVDIDTDEDVRNYENAKDGDWVASAVTPMVTDAQETTNNGNKEENLPDKHTTVDEDTMDKKDRGKGGLQTNSMDVDSSRSFDIVNTGKINKWTQGCVLVGRHKCQPIGIIGGSQ